MIWRYPVKSMAGETLDEVDVSATGVAGDRTWAVVDSATGIVCSAKHPRRWGSLLTCRARLLDDQHNVEVRLPSGEVVSSIDPQTTDDALSRLVDHPVELRHIETIADRSIERTDPLPEDPGVAGPGNGVAAAGPLELDEVAAFDLGAEAGGTLFDFCALHAITVATLAAIAAAVSSATPTGPGRDEAIGPEEIRARLRPNLVIDAGTDAFDENRWPGGTVTIGDLACTAVVPTPRCIVPTLAQAELGALPGLARTLARINRVEIQGLGPRPVAGVYLSPKTSSRVQTGDPVRR